MAKSKKQKEDEEISNEIGDINDAFKVLDDLNPHASFLNESSLSNVSDWIDTGSYALNAIISGSLFGGVPMGRLSGFIGPESCGKTLLINKIMANAQKKDIRVVYYDSENALDKNTAKRLGCDPSKIKHCPIEITEKCRNEIVAFLDKIKQLNLQGKVILAIDSVGNLITTQEKKKMDEGVFTPDMGERAKSLKSMMRALTHATAQANVPLIFSNHIYDDPSKLHKSAIKQQAGGSGPLYMSSIIVQIAKVIERITGEGDKNRDGNTEATELSKNMNGLTLRALTTKNRFIPPFLETEMYLNFKTGLNPYSGLLDMAVAYEVIEKVGHRYAFDGDIIGFYKDWKDRKDIWEDLIMPKLDTVLKEKLSFKNEIDHAADDIENDENIDDVELKTEDTGDIVK